MSDELYTTHSSEESYEGIDMEELYDIVKDLNKIREAEPYIFRFNDEITLQNLYHMIQDIVTRYGLTTIYMKMLLKKESLKKLYQDLPEHIKIENKSYNDIKSIFNIPIYESNYIKEKCVIMYIPKGYDDFISIEPNIGKI